MPLTSRDKHTGFYPKFSGKANASDSVKSSLFPCLTACSGPSEAGTTGCYPDLEAGHLRPFPATNGEAFVARDTTKVKEKEEAERDHTPPVRKRRDSDGGRNMAANGHASADGEGSRRAARNGVAATVRSKGTTTSFGLYVADKWRDLWPKLVGLYFNIHKSPFISRNWIIG